MIPGYEVIEVLHENRRYKIFRAVNKKDNTHVILKVAQEIQKTKKKILAAVEKRI